MPPNWNSRNPPLSFAVLNRSTEPPNRNPTALLRPFLSTTPLELLEALSPPTASATPDSPVIQPTLSDPVDSTAVEDTQVPLVDARVLEDDSVNLRVAFMVLGPIRLLGRSSGHRNIPQTQCEREQGTNGGEVSLDGRPKCRGSKWEVEVGSVSQAQSQEVLEGKGNAADASI
ncbi:hypothetical protein C8F04DRAFT_1192605 [Mycena alexandri]|uniref:Uncharacterized protein n=1 Tax=Mycena alexandri TaxID=1745969 RepID=A0AAD6SAL7_9AGAR|nr:hypothetical protein C8F04DRAFT_1192605 [Mycena alexandri]